MIEELTAFEVVINEYIIMISPDIISAKEYAVVAKASSSRHVIG